MSVLFELAVIFLLFHNGVLPKLRGCDGGKLMKYMVRYYGFVIVEADDAQEALDKAQNDEEEYEEYEWEYPELFGEEN